MSAICSSTTNAQCSGRWPGVCTTRIRVRSDLAGSVTVRERLERVLGLGERMDRDRQTVLEREPSVARDVVGVRVRLEHALDPRPAPAAVSRYCSISKGRVDDDGDACVGVADQIRGTAEILVDELPEEEHGVERNSPAGEAFGSPRSADRARGGLRDHHPLHLVGAFADLEDLLVAIEA